MVSAYYFLFKWLFSGCSSYRCSSIMFSHPFWFPALSSYDFAAAIWLQVYCLPSQS